MTAIPASAIRLSYLLPCNAAHAAFVLSDKFKVRISALALTLRWEEECATCAPMRELGERPEKGFAPSPYIDLVRKLIEAMPDEVAA